MGLKIAPIVSACLAASILAACNSISMRAPPPGGSVSRPFTMPEPATPVFARPEAPPRTIVVGPGDTLDGIARSRGVTLQALAQLNNIPPPYSVRVGQYLLLPPAPPTPVAQPPAPISVPATTERIVLRPPSGVVRLDPRSAQPFGAPAGLPSSSLTPRGGEVHSGPLAPLAPPGPSAPTLSPPRQEARVPPEPPPVAAVPETATVDEAAVGRLPPRAGRSFAWPVRGAIASDFGPKPGGLANDGINISAPRGTAVRAADNGVVTYAGNELRGFGNLVLIRHAGGWVTAYAHLDGIDVQTGAEVQRGQIVGRVGQTGNVAEPQLHFEIRRAGSPVNPRQFLTPQTAER